MTSTVHDAPATAPGAIAQDRWVDNAVYHDEAVYRAELERVFDRCWLFVCHASEIPEPGDYVGDDVAGSPIIVVRDHDRSIRAFANTCRHRGAKVVTDDRGNCGSAFRCAYHFWTYGTDGSLKGVPGVEAYDGTGFDKDAFGLVPVACDELLGLVFVSMTEPTMPLRDWLGAELLDVLARPLADPDLVVFQHNRRDEDLNWKVFAENARDGYHVPFVHPFFRKASPPGSYQLYPNGHAVQQLGVDPAGIDPDMWGRIRQHPFPGIAEGEGWIANVFPDLNITLRYNMVSIDSQQALGITGVRIENRTLGLRGDDDATLAVRAESQRVWFQDPVTLEDDPVFFLQQHGVSSRVVPASVIARGHDKMSGTRGDDNRLRWFWVQWRQMMGTGHANSLDPTFGLVKPC